MRRQSSSAKGLKAAAPAPVPALPPVQTTVLIELALPLGIGLSSTNAVTDLQANADAQWQLGDRICWADGKEVRAGKIGVAQAIDRSRTVHTFVVQRWAPPTPGEVLITCRIHGDPGLGIGLTDKNAINQLTAGKPALQRGLCHDRVLYQFCCEFRNDLCNNDGVYVNQTHYIFNMWFLFHHLNL